VCDSFKENVLFELAILKLTAFCNLDCSYCYMFNELYFELKLDGHKIILCAGEENSWQRPG
jgi:hypothetical protein